jgi:hypothetical protein
VFESATGDITGMYLSDEEGEMTTVSCCCLLYHLIARCVSYLKTSDVIASPFDSKSSSCSRCFHLRLSFCLSL